MSKLENRTGTAMRVGLLSATGHAFVGLLLAAWSVAVAAVIIVPAVLFAVVAARATRWLAPRNGGQPHRPLAPRRPLIIEGEYEVLNSGPGQG